MKKRSESIVDFLLVFIAVGMFTLGITRIWVWFNANYAGRQVDYQESRALAGKAGTYNNLGQNATTHLYPKIGTAAKDLPTGISCPSCAHKPLDLPEKWVFSSLNDFPAIHKIHYEIGGAGGTIGYGDCYKTCGALTTTDAQGNVLYVKDADGSIVWGAANPLNLVPDPDPNLECKSPAMTKVTIIDPNTHIPAEMDKPLFNTSCSCLVKCNCMKSLLPTLNGFTKQVQSLCGTGKDAAGKDIDNCVLLIPCNKMKDDKHHKDRKVCMEKACKGKCTETKYVVPKNPVDATEFKVKPDCGQACQLVINAKAMDKAADECDDWLDMCWWGTWGKAADEMYDAARQLRKAAGELAKEGETIQAQINKVKQCCDKPTNQLQQECLQYGQGDCNSRLQYAQQSLDATKDGLEINGNYTTAMLGRAQEIDTGCANPSYEEGCLYVCTDGDYTRHCLFTLSKAEEVNPTYSDELLRYTIDYYKQKSPNQYKTWLALVNTNTNNKYTNDYATFMKCMEHRVPIKSKQWLCNQKGINKAPDAVKALCAKGSTFHGTGYLYSAQGKDDTCQWDGMDRGAVPGWDYLYQNCGLLGILHQLNYVANHVIPGLEAEVDRKINSIPSCCSAVYTGNATMEDTCMDCYTTLENVATVNQCTQCVQDQVPLTDDNGNPVKDESGTIITRDKTYDELRECVTSSGQQFFADVNATFSSDANNKATADKLGNWTGPTGPTGP